MKVVFVTGGVLSGLGKGVAAASIGHLLSHEYRVIPVKCDGYLNTDPGTMNPTEHGEVFVLEDGGEVDMDFGHYERFLRVHCKSEWSLTMGKVFERVMKRERKGDYLGKTVQFIPHVTDEIKAWWRRVAQEEGAEVLIVEIGGTIGDIENELYVEAARQLALELGHGCALFAHLTYAPILGAVGEQKSKPTQQSVTLLRQRGINPDILLVRSESQLEQGVRAKIGMFASLPTSRVFNLPNVRDIYDLPAVIESQGMLPALNELLELKATHNTCHWSKLIERLHEPEHALVVGIAGKYTQLGDSYASIAEALKHCAAATRTAITMRLIETSELEHGDVAKALAGVHAVIVPGGFGNRGIEGKISIIKYCREHDIPFLGICYGMQLAVVEFARNVCGLDAHTREVRHDAPHPVIDLLPEQHSIAEKGGTMRLGNYIAHIEPSTRVHELYGTSASERHRHRYEVNPDYHGILRRHGMVFSGTSRGGVVAEFMELPDKRYFVGTQGHPELKSRLEQPAPLFLGLVQAALTIQRETS